MSRPALLGILALLLVFCGCLCGLLAAEKPKKTARDDSEVLALTGKRSTEMTRITEAPFEMDRTLVAPCGPYRNHKFTTKSNPHLSHYVHVYITNDGNDIIKSGKGEYRVGTFILKEKLPGISRELVETNMAKFDKNAVPDLFTAMLKREKGFNPECGDWEFIIISGNNKQILSRGKTDSCMDCHKDYRNTDFVTREYMKK